MGSGPTPGPSHTLRSSRRVLTVCESTDPGSWKYGGLPPATVINRVLRRSRGTAWQAYEKGSVLVWNLKIRNPFVEGWPGTPFVISTDFSHSLFSFLLVSSSRLCSCHKDASAGGGEKPSIRRAKRGQAVHLGCFAPPPGCLARVERRLRPDKVGDKGQALPRRYASVASTSRVWCHVAWICKIHMEADNRRFHLPLPGRRRVAVPQIPSATSLATADGAAVRCISYLVRSRPIPHTVP